MPLRHIETKIVKDLSNSLSKSEKKVAHYKEKTVELHSEVRRLRQTVEETKKSREIWKSRYKTLYKGLVQGEKEVKVGCSVQISHEVAISDGIEGHKYSRYVVSLCMSLYALSGCSLRGVIRVLMCLQLELGLKAEEIPSKSSVQNWLQKLGYYAYHHYGEATYAGSYGLIIDECMVIGQQRMVVALGIESDKEGKDATKLGDVRLLYLGVKSSWNYEQVGDLLQKVTEKMSKKPEYVISDGAGNLTKGIKAAQLVRLCDIGHEIGKFLEQTYRQDEAYNAFTKAAALVKSKEVMKETAYLLPPKQRAIARFMNISSTVTWAVRLLNVFDSLTPNEQQTFIWLKDYKNLITELDNTFNLAHSIMKIIKNEGLSYQNIAQCLDLMPPFISKVKLTIITKITTYFKNEKEKLPNSETVWHASSDVIESLFGKYKSITACNKLNGITPHVLSLCVLTHFDGQKELIKDTLRDALTNVSMADLDGWKQKYLVDNQVIRRKKLLNT